MRLLHTKTSSPKLKEISEDKIESGEIRYAILSHKWGDDEITFQDLLHLQENDGKKKTKGYEKIQRLRQKVADQFDYVWIDTCCINKESSAEISEAINSMSRWYQLAEVCYAYLYDVAPTGDEHELHTRMTHSQWFKRGWTLQELIAPSNVVFLATDWSEIGCRKTLGQFISRITLIDESILHGVTHPREVSIAKRMSWASRRVTTRTEDIAYCLIGIFNVNMPLLYGEGEKAFLRLQEEIMKDSDDQTLFAWENPTVSYDSPSGLLAQSPADFKTTGDMIPYSFSSDPTPFSITNRGIKLHLPVVITRQEGERVRKAGARTLGADILILECQDASEPLFRRLVGVKLIRRPRKRHQFLRVDSRLERHIAWGLLYYTKPMTIFVMKSFTPRRDLGRPVAYPRACFHSSIHPEDRSQPSNLVLCFDNQVYQSTQIQSNIKIIHNLLSTTNAPQLGYYDNVSGKTTEAGKACVIGAYKWLANHYNIGDNIYLFGFSKGAFVAQTLAQILENMGIFSRDKEFHYIDYMWDRHQDWYHATRGDHAHDSSGRKISANSALLAMNNFRDCFCTSTGRVAFLGLFDTANVTSDLPITWGLDIRWGPNSRLPSELSHPAHIVRHAVSIDEQNPALQPILVGDTIFQGAQDVKQVWFIGSHSDIGGITPVRKDDSLQSDTKWSVGHIPLIWMICEATKAGLQFNPIGLIGYFGNNQQSQPKSLFGGNNKICSVTHHISSSNHLKKLLRHVSIEGKINNTASFRDNHSLLSIIQDTVKDYLPLCILDLESRLVDVMVLKFYWRDIPSGSTVHSSFFRRKDARPIYHRPGDFLARSDNQQANATLRYLSNGRFVEYRVTDFP